MKKITNKHNVTFYEAKTEKTLTGKVVFRKISKCLYVYATLSGQQTVLANNENDALDKILAQL